MNRRQLLVGTAGVALLLSVAGCGPTLTDAPQWVQGINAIGTVISSLASDLSSAGVSSDVVTPIKGYITDIEQVASAITSTSTTVDGQTALQKIEGLINEIAPIVIPLVTIANPAIGGTLGLVVAAIPAIEAAVNLATTLLSQSSQELASTAPLPAGVVLEKGKVRPGTPGASITRWDTKAFLPPSQALQKLIEQAAAKH